MDHEFLIHEDKDNVGVAVKDIQKGENSKGVSLNGNKKIMVEAQEDIPLAHKIAINNISKGKEVIKYGVVIGTADEAIPSGGYVHEHNISSVRWKVNE